MPAGGLTSYTDGPDFAPCAAPSAVRGPPLEEHLAQNTLWPEAHKLYGHGNDVFCTAASHDGRYAASACVAKSASAAEVWVWAIDGWESVAQLQVRGAAGLSSALSHLTFETPPAAATIAGPLKGSTALMLPRLTLISSSLPCLSLVRLTR